MPGLRLIERVAAGPVGRAVRRALLGHDAALDASDFPDEDAAARRFQRDLEDWIADDEPDDPYGDDEGAWWERA